MNLTIIYLAAIGINLIVLVFIAYTIIKLKKMIKREIENGSNY